MITKIFTLVFLSFGMGVLIFNLETLGNEPLNIPGGKPEADPYIAKQVKNTIVKRAKYIQECWLEELKRKPEQNEIKIEMDWQIKATGEVIDSEIVQPQEMNKTFSSCLISRIKKIKFPPHDAKVPKYIVHKFTFSKEK